MITLNNFKVKMIEKARARGGVWENFGDKELRGLKDKHDYRSLLINDHCLTSKEIKTRNKIDNIRDWCYSFVLKV